MIIRSVPLTSVFLLATTFGFSSFATEKPASSKWIHVEFAGLSNDLEIAAAWQPTEPYVCGDGSVIGNAFLKIRQISSGLVSELAVSNVSFIIQYDDGSNSDIVDRENLNSISSLNVDLANYKPAYETKCRQNNDQCLILSEAPISFVDLNYDGLDELIVRQPCSGQRHRDTFKVFEFQHDVSTPD